MKKLLNQKAFSLIEIMVAFSILMVAFISLTGTFPTALAINKGAENASIASYLAQQKIEEIAANDYFNIATGTQEALHKLATSSTDFFYNFERQAAVYNVDGNMVSTTTDTGMKVASTTVFFTDTQKSRRSYNLLLLISQK